MALAPSTRIGPYEILALIGAGGMGEVYRARDTRLGRDVAIKILPPHLSSDPVRKQRFEREAKTISSLNHPHICVLYDVGRQEGIDYLVMECVAGETLAKRLEKGPLPLEQVLRFGAQIAEALDKAHRSGIVHRDLKPGNIMLTASGVKLLDFGLAKPVAPLASLATLTATKHDSPATEQGTIVGTFQYMSPEQIEGKEIDGRSDVFSLGAVLYEMVTGKKAFEGKSQLSVASAILEKEPEPISALKPMTPPAVDHAVRSCLAKDPEERWQTARDLQLELHWAGEGDMQGSAGTRVGTRRKTSALMGWALAAICFLAVVALATEIWMRVPLPTEEIRSSLLPPPGAAFLPYSFAISPDGTHLAFVALGPDGQTALWVRSISSSGMQQLSGTEGATSPFWSPDSREIGFFAEGRLKTIDITGATVKILCEAAFDFGGTWNREGTILFAPNLYGPLYRVQASGGTPVPVTTMPSAEGFQAHRWPFFLRDGKHFLFSVEWNGPENKAGNGIYEGSLDSSQTKMVVPGVTGHAVFASGYLLFVHDRSLQAQRFDTNRLETMGSAATIVDQALEANLIRSQWGFSVSQNGLLVFQSAADAPTRLIWYDPAGKELSQFAEGGYSDPDISPDGQFLAVSSDDEHNGKHFVRVYDLKRGISTRLTDGGHEYSPVWSRDGKRLMYGAPAGIFPSYEIPADGSGPPRLLAEGARVAPSDWAPDGKVLFITLSRVRPIPSLEIYSPGKQRMTPFVGQGVEGKFSPDGKWIAYIGPGAGVLVQPYPGPGSRIQISNGLAGQPRWSHDGRQIFYIRRDRKLMAVSFDPRHAQVSPPRVVFQTRIVATHLAAWQYDVAPDGRFLINSLPSNTNFPLSVLVNWTEELKER